MTARKTSLMIAVSGYGLILFIFIAFVFSRYVRVEISSFFYYYFHGFFIYMVLDFAFRDWSVMVFVLVFLGIIVMIH